MYKSAEACFWTADYDHPHFRDVRRLDMPTVEGPRPADPMARNRSGPNLGMSPCDTPAADGLQVRKPAPGDPALRGILGVCLGFQA